MDPDPLPASEYRKMVHAAIGGNPRALTSMVASQLGIPECEVVRYLPDHLSQELDATRVVDIIRSFEHLGVVHVIVNSGTVVIEAQGAFGGFSTTGPFLNVQTNSLDMHIKYKELAFAFAVEKPSHMEGSKTLSLQFFSNEGKSAFKVFLNFTGTPSNERQEYYDKSIREFGLHV